jgi:hypothetical protein
MHPEHAEKDYVRAEDGSRYFMPLIEMAMIGDEERIVSGYEVLHAIVRVQRNWPCRVERYTVPSLDEAERMLAIAEEHGSWEDYLLTTGKLASRQNHIYLADVEELERQIKTDGARHKEDAVE